MLVFDSKRAKYEISKKKSLTDRKCHHPSAVPL